MKKFSVYILLLLSALSFESCKEKPHIINLEQVILFQMDYINFAWGYHHHGFMIDSDGRILTYENPEKWNFADDNLILTEDQIAENISMCRILPERIPLETLNKYSSYINNIAGSKITARRQTGADAGTLQFICYKFSGNSMMYKGFLIKTEGDFTEENLNFYSKKVVSWMKEINENIAVR